MKQNPSLNETPIDIVLPWVDGSDKAWQKCKAEYLNEPLADAREERFRDWGVLKYVFRSIETNLPWARTVHFVTWGHIPKWLNCAHPKLKIVRHEDFIPQEYLPTFSSHPIELNLHRISELESKFVYFNDDMFILHKP